MWLDQLQYYIPCFLAQLQHRNQLQRLRSVQLEKCDEYESTKIKMEVAVACFKLMFKELWKLK
jgi:hypothetical protein